MPAFPCVSDITSKASMVASHASDPPQPCVWISTKPGIKYFPVISTTSSPSISPILTIFPFFTSTLVFTKWKLLSSTKPFLKINLFHPFEIFAHWAVILILQQLNPLCKRFVKYFYYYYATIKADLCKICSFYLKFGIRITFTHYGKAARFPFPDQGRLSKHV